MCFTAGTGIPLRTAAFQGSLGWVEAIGHGLHDWAGFCGPKAWAGFGMDLEFRLWGFGLSPMGHKYGFGFKVQRVEGPWLNGLRALVQKGFGLGSPARCSGLEDPVRASGTI